MEVDKDRWTKIDNKDRITKASKTRIPEINKDKITEVDKDR